MTETELLSVKRWLRQWAIHWRRTPAAPWQVRMREQTGRTFPWN